MSSGASWSETRKLTVNVCERSRPHTASQFFERQPNPTLDRAERQAGVVRDLVVGLATDKGAPNQVGLAGREPIDKLPEQLCPRRRGELVEDVANLRIGQTFR